MRYIKVKPFVLLRMNPTVKRSILSPAEFKEG